MRCFAAPPRSRLARSRSLHTHTHTHTHTVGLHRRYHGSLLVTDDSVHVCRVQFWSCRSGSSCCTHTHTHTHSPRHTPPLSIGLTPISSTDNTATTCDRPLRRCVNLPRRRLLRSALTAAALLRQSATHCRELSLTVTLLLCLGLG